MTESLVGVRPARPAPPRERLDTPLAELTTLRLGSRARRLVEAPAEDHIIETVAAADLAGDPALVIAGGLNPVIADAGFDGTVVRILTRGVSAARTAEGVRLTVAAGQPWDELVKRAVAGGLAGVECLAGIPGSTGATPIQNVGAYGQQVSDTITAVRVYDRLARRVAEFARSECAFASRSSLLRGSSRFIVLAVTFALERCARPRGRSRTGRSRPRPPG